MQPSLLFLHAGEQKDSKNHSYESSAPETAQRLFYNITELLHLHSYNSSLSHPRCWAESNSHHLCSRKHLALVFLSFFYIVKQATSSHIDTHTLHLRNKRLYSSGNSKHLNLNVRINWTFSFTLGRNLYFLPRYSPCIQTKPHLQPSVCQPPKVCR